MTTGDPSGMVPSDPAASDAEAIRKEIEDTREQLGDTVAALSAKADVKAQASAKADELTRRAHEITGDAKARAGELTEQAKRRPVPLIAGGAVLVAAVWLLRRWRRGRRARHARLSVASPIVSAA
jgi:hypothetical protein